MKARDVILGAIRSADVPPSPAASPMRAETATVDLLEQFLRVLSDVGGRGVVLEPHQSVDNAVGELRKTIAADAAAELVVVPGRFAVAENAAVYVDSGDIANRADIVRAEHVVLTVSRRTLVQSMHEAMRLMPSDSRCGWFLSGPSKTADIEQSLVIGAQGARTLHVLIESS